MATILIIDDEEDFREVLRFILEFEGYEVFEAGKGDAGIKAFRKCNPDLVITDIFMPGKEGLEAIRQFHTLDPDVKIIAMSGEVATECDRQLYVAGELGAGAAIHKPFRASEVRALISEQLESSCH